MYIVYVLKSQIQQWHYVGHTKNLTQRLKAHNAGKVRSTKAYRPFTVIYKETYPDKSTAFKREQYYKSGAGNQVLREKLMAQGVW